MAERHEAQGYLSGTGVSHRAHGCCFAGLGRLWRHGRAEAVGVPAVQPAHLRALLPRRETGVPTAQSSGTRHSVNSYGRKRRIRRKLGDYGQLSAIQYPPKPQGMWRRTYARSRTLLECMERKMTGRMS
jgi:hypothetical protein